MLCIAGFIDDVTFAHNGPYAMGACVTLEQLASLTVQPQPGGYVWLGRG